jgi:sugar phosphate isomerase/epimerase
MKLAAFADEINRQDPARALLLARRWAIPAIEVRGLPSGRFPRVPDAELEDFTRLVGDAGVQVSGVSPGLFKSPVGDAAVEDGIAELLPRACEWARRWNTDQVSVFACRRDDAPSGSTDIPAAVVDTLGRMVEVASAQGCRLVLENVGGCWGDTGHAASALLRQMGDERLALCWDPGNSAGAGATSPYPGEYDGLRDRVAHVHCKNHDPAVGGWSLMDTGLVDWPAQIQALADDDYSGFLVVETHTSEEPAGAEPIVDAGETLAPLEANTLRNLRYLRSLLD